MENITNHNDDVQDNDELNSSEYRAEQIKRKFEQENLPEGFELDHEGLWYNEEGSKSKTPSRCYVCSALRVVAIVRDHANENHGRLLEFEDVDGYSHQWSMPMELLAGDSVRLREVLLNMGLIITPERRARDLLIRYIQSCKPITRVRCVLQTGWNRYCYVFPNETIGAKANEKVIYQSSTHNVEKDSEYIAGTLEEWQKQVSAYCRGNSRLILALCAAFAAPLLHLVKQENIGLHLIGPSSIGKTTALRVATSVFGGPQQIQSYRSTSNGLEAIATIHNDRILAMDELGQIPNPKEAGEIFYMLGNGVGKQRSNKLCKPRDKDTWRIVFISSGEIGLAQLLEQEGKKIKAGQEVRVVDVSSNMGTHGIFENLHGFENGDSLSKHFRAVCSKNYGTASREFIRRVADDREASIDLVKTVVEGLTQRECPTLASGQVSRVLHHFATIAAAGELATSFGISGWDIGEAETAVMRCFQDWLRTRGGAGLQEEKAALAQVKKFFEQHGESRFSPFEGVPIAEKTPNRVGFKKKGDDGIEFYVLPESFKTEICRGLDPNFVADICVKNGLIKTDSTGSSTRSERLPGYEGTKRCYRFLPKVLIDESFQDYLCLKNAEQEQNI